MSLAGPNDIGFFLSGGSTNKNPHLSTGGAISTTKIFPKTFNNLWSDISERQARYGHKDIRIIYLKNLHPTLTFKNMRVYWNESDNFTSMQIGRAPVGGIENTAASIAALLPSDNPIPPSMWDVTLIAADDFRIVQDFNNPNSSTGRPFGDGHANGSNKGVHVESASAAISNQKIARFTARIRRNGTAQGDVFCKIWDSSGNEKATMGSVNSSTLPTGTGNFAEAVFTNQTNTYSMQTGDIIGLDYPGATSSDTISWQVVEWTGEGAGSEVENIQYNIIGTDEWHKSSSSGTWLQTEAGRSELVYRAEIFGPPSVSNFRVVQDYNDTGSITGRPFGGNSANGDRLAVHIVDSSSSMINQKIARFSCYIRRNGSPAGNVNCKVWDSSGNEKASIGSANSSTLVTGTGNFSEAVFTNQGNTYPMQVGDLIGLEYPGAGEDEGEGSQEDQISWAVWDWRPEQNPDNISKDITGTDEFHRNDGIWSRSVGGQSELVYKAEIFGPEGGGGGPCTPDGGPGPGEPPDIPSGFIIMQDFSDINAQTGYQVGSGAPNNTFRQAVSIDGSTAPILSAPIARITFLLRRVGNPVGTVSCRIWTNTGVVMQTLGQIEATSITNQAGQWTQAAFTLQDNNYTMKIGDLIGVEFTTGSNVDHILVAGWTWASTAAAAAAGEAGETAAATDKFGVRMIYPNSGNFHYENEWEIPGSSSSMRWDYVNPPLNAEMTCYFFKSSPSSDTISCKIRGGRHTDSAKNDGCCYILQFPCTGGTMEFQIECPHPNNHDCSTSGIDGTALSMSTWHGYKAIWWNIGNPATTVHMEAWQDKGNNSGSTPVNQWEKLQVHDDSSGNCGNISNPLFRPKGSTSQCTFRIDENSGTSYKWLSIVEIQPGGEVPPDGGGGSPPGAKDIPGTSIKRWNGTVWIANDGGMSDLVFKAEKFTVLPGEEQPRDDPIIIDPGTKRKPTSYDQGIVFPPLEPGDYKALILERLFPPDPDEIGQDDIEQQIVAEIDATTEAEQPQDPNNPPLPQPPPTPPTIPPPTTPPGQLGPYASTGKQLSASTRRAVRHYASGKADDETVEKNTKNIPYQHYQCVYFVTMHGVEHDDTVSSKLGGTHMGSGWHDHGVSFNQGKCCLGTEPEHPDTNSCIIVGANIGSIIEKRLGLCTIWRKPSKHTELWTKLPGGPWVKQLQNTGALGGFTPNNSGGDEAQLRIDGFTDGDDPTIDTAVVQEIAPD